jgi:hypothetical protein
MAEESNREFEVLWDTLLPLLAALGGIIAQFGPLVSARPPTPLEKSMEGGSAIFLRRTAEQLRSSALENMCLARLRSYAHPLEAGNVG